MLWLVGLGISGYKGLSIEGLDVLRSCDTVYVEGFTGALTKNDISALGSLVGKSVIPVKRWFVEDGRQILEQAESKKIALVTFGDPLIATTHNELRIRAHKKSIQVQIVHSASGIASLIGECGLHIYKFGRTVTVMSEPQSILSAYSAIFDNLLSGNHTLILTEFSQADNGYSNHFYLNPLLAFKMLEDEEKNQKHMVFSVDTFGVVLSRIGKQEQKIFSGKVKSLLNCDFGEGPHSVIITGPLHFTESDALVNLTDSLDSPTDNSLHIKKISAQMVEKYGPKAKEAIDRMRAVIKSQPQDEHNRGFHEVLDNAEYYVIDAQKFLRLGKLELAVLSVGYAEGLIDSLRFQKGINPWL